MEDFCEVPGLTVQLVSTSEQLEKRTVHSDGLPYAMWHYTVSDVYTNVETGKSATEIAAENERIVRVTDNGDGTLTIIEFKVHNREIYDEDGGLIGQRDGHFTVKKTMYHQGTLSLGGDDVNVESNVPADNVVENGDDFCTVMLEEIG
jgi:hypothetical protein